MDTAQLHVVFLTTDEVRRLLKLADREWTTLDRERPAMSPHEQEAALADQRVLEEIQEHLRRAL